MNVVLFFVFVFYLAASSCSQNPGIQITVNKNGINLAQRVARDELSREMQSKNLGRMGVSGGSLTNVRITNFYLGSSSATTSSPNRFTLVINRARLAASFNYGISKRIVWKLKVTAKGRATISASGIRIRQDILLAKDKNGRPRISPGSCTASIGSFDYSLRGDLFSWLVNILKRFLKNNFRKNIEREICPSIRDSLNNIGRDELSKIKQNFPLLEYQINLDLVRNPEASQSGITAAFRGQCFSRSRRSPPSYPFPAPPMTPPISSVQMVRISISNYVLDTLLHTMWLQNKLQEKFSHENIMRIGETITTLSGLSDSSQDEARYSIEIRTTHAPTSKFTTSGIEINFLTQFKIYADIGNDKQWLESLNLDARASINIKIVNGKLSGRIVSLKITTSDTKGIPKSSLNSILSSFLEEHVVSAVNAVAESGFKFPEAFNYRVKNPTIQHQNGHLSLGADFTHS